MSCVSPSGGEHCRRSQCNVAHDDHDEDEFCHDLESMYCGF